MTETLETLTRLRRWSLGALGLAALALTGGCRDLTRIDDITAVHLNDPEKRHAIGLGRRAETLVVEVPRDASGLTRNQEADVIRFVDRYKSEAEGRLRVSAPSGSRDRQAASRTLRDVQALVEDAGLDRRAVQVASHGGGDGVRLSYDKVTAIPPYCGDWSEDVGESRERLHYPQFGCATQNNFAVMLDTPRDLVTPRAETPRPHDKRGSSWAKYSDSGGGGGGGGANSSQGATDSAGKAGGGGGSVVK